MTTFAAVLLLLIVAFWFGYIGPKWKAHTGEIGFLVPLRRARGEDLPKLVAFVPARNEEGGIERAVRSLLTQDYPNLTVVCANDHSTDRTGEILTQLKREFSDDRLIVFDVPALPRGWMGKCHALYRAVEHAPDDAELYLFTDADVVHEPGTLRRAVETMRRRKADLFAIFPRFDCESFWEHIAMPLTIHIGLSQLDLRRLNDPRSNVAAGIGAFGLIRRETYEKWGGHEAIKGEVLDDLAMGLMTKAVGGRTVVTNDQHAVHLRMYSSMSAIIRGFEKNAHTAMGERSFAVIALLCIPLTLVYAGAFLISLIAALAGAWVLAAVAFLLYVAQGVSLANRTRRFVRNNRLVVVFFYPLAVLLNVFIFLKSAWHGSVQGVVLWRGRTLEKPEQKVRIL